METWPNFRSPFPVTPLSVPPAAVHGDRTGIPTFPPSAPSSAPHPILWLPPSTPLLGRPPPFFPSCSTRRQVASGGQI